MTRLLVLLAGACVLLAGCGQATSDSSTPLTVYAGAGLDPGPGVAFAPRGSVLYLRTPGSGSAWDTLSARRAVIKRWNFDIQNPLANLLTMITGRDLSVPPDLEHALTGETSEFLIAPQPSNGPARNARQVVWYSGVAGASAMRAWLQKTYTPSGSYGGYALWKDKRSYGGWSAVSDNVWLWAGAEAALRTAIDTAAGKQPSLRDDPQFTSAMRTVDPAGAAVVGYTRGDLSTELKDVYDPTIESDDLGPKLTRGLGLADTAFAMGANDDGIWMRAAPHSNSDGFQPGDVFTPTLADKLPEGAVAYVGSTNSGLELGGIAKAFGPLLGNEDHPDPGAPALDHFVQGMFGLTPADVAAVDDGEEAWYYGSATGVMFKPSDPDRAQQVLEAAAARSHGTLTETRDGDVVSIQRPTLPNSTSRRMPGDTPADLVHHAGIEQASLVVAADLAILHDRGDEPGGDSSGSSQPQPFSALNGFVVAASPGTAGRYDFELYVELTDPG